MWQARTSSHRERSCSSRSRAAPRRWRPQPSNVWHGPIPVGSSASVRTHKSTWMRSLQRSVSRSRSCPTPIRTRLPTRTASSRRRPPSPSKSDGSVAAVAESWDRAAWNRLSAILADAQRRAGAGVRARGRAPELRARVNDAQRPLGLSGRFVPSGRDRTRVWHSARAAHGDGRCGETDQVLAEARLGRRGIQRGTVRTDTR